ncbi:unnamed protein product, partial [Cyprideis torosa]
MLLSSNSSDHGWFVYMVKCADDSLYTGITTEPERRLQEHNSSKAAKYTRSRQPVVLVYLESVGNRSEASKREFMIKRLSRGKKQQL